MNQSADIQILFLDDGCPAIISQPGMASRPVTVLFNRNTLDAMGVQTDKPGIIIQDTDLAGYDLATASITVTGKFPEARLMRPEEDGLGLTTALLTRR